jgi:hypothetical protein
VLKIYFWKLNVRNSYKQGMIYDIFTLMHKTHEFKIKQYCIYMPFTLSPYHHTSHHHTRTIDPRTVEVIKLLLYHTILPLYLYN